MDKKCQNCKILFEITNDDMGFYERIHVPPPTWCPKCRQLRRYAWRNERTLYRRKCGSCSKSMVTIYSQDKPYKVYCNDCWWGDGWDPASYGRDFDFSRPFFEQFAELQHDAPRMALLNKNSTNSEYTNHSANNKNAYMSFSVMDSEDIMYSTWIMDHSRDCMDCSFIYEKGERLYDCIDSRTSYQCQYGIFLRDCSSCYYCYDCRGCSDCFMSYNLRNKSYCIKNVQYTREEYMKKMKEYDLSSFVVRTDLEKEFRDMLANDAVHKYAINERNVNSVGSMLYDCRNVHQSFELSKCENCKYVYGAPSIKDCMDLYHVGFQTELCYELQGCVRVANCQFCHLCYDNMNIMYCDTCQNSQNLFGCVSVKKGEYMILNKKYSKAEYEDLKKKIVEHMKNTGEYGEFFPPQIAPVYYNETQGAYYAPMSKDEVLALGWQWEENVPGTFGKETISSADIPDKIQDVPESYLNEILSCIDCKRNYNVVQNELLFYRKENLPLPRKCPNCRYRRRFDLRLKRELWHRQCMCQKDHPQHKGRCKIEFETSYPPERAESSSVWAGAPDRPEIVYCEECYNKEVY